MPLAKAAPKSGSGAPVSVQTEDDVYKAFRKEVEGLLGQLLMPEQACVHKSGPWRDRLLPNWGARLLPLGVLSNSMRGIASRLAGLRVTACGRGDFVQNRLAPEAELLTPTPCHSNTSSLFFPSPALGEICDQGNLSYQCV